MLEYQLNYLGSMDERVPCTGLWGGKCLTDGTDLGQRVQCVRGEVGGGLPHRAQSQSTSCPRGPAPKQLTC